MTSANERLVKKRITGAPHRVIVRCAREWRDECKAEIDACLAACVHPPKFQAVVEATDDGVMITELDVRAMLQLALELRTAKAMLWSVVGGKASGRGALKKVVESVEWPLFLAPGALVALKATSTASRLFHEGLVRDVAEEVVVAAGGEVVAADDATLFVEMRLKKDVASVGLHLTAQPLHRRGYRAVLRGQAPLREDLAAACISATKPADGVDDVVAPFAGSGTLGFEALMTFGGIAPAAFLDLERVAPFPGTPADSRRHARKTLLTRANAKPPRVTFVEIDPAQNEILAQNGAGFAARAQEATRHAYEIETICEDFARFDWAKFAGRRVYCPMNPPYGHRLDAKGGVVRLYRDTAKTLLRGIESGVPEITGFILAAEPSCGDAFKKELRGWAFTERDFRNGGLAVRLIGFRSP